MAFSEGPDAFLLIEVGPSNFWLLFIDLQKHCWSHLRIMMFFVTSCALRKSMKRQRGHLVADCLFPKLMVFDFVDSF